MRRTPVVIFAALAAAALAALFQLRPSLIWRPASPELKEVRFTIAGATYTMQVPEKAVLEQHEPGKAVMVRDYTRSIRLERTLVLAPAAGPSTASCEHAARLSDGTTFEHCGPDDIGGGSGGPTQELSGVLGRGSKYLNVSCRDQSEHGADARWCLPALGSLRAAR